MVNLFSNSFSLSSIEGVIFDKDGTITDSNIYWSKIIKMRAQKIIDYYGIKQIHFKKICYSMGLDNSSNKLLFKSFNNLYLSILYIFILNILSPKLI